jgi:hypothetical protein
MQHARLTLARAALTAAVGASILFSGSVEATDKEDLAQYEKNCEELLGGEFISSTDDSGKQGFACVGLTDADGNHGDDQCIQSTEIEGDVFDSCDFHITEDRQLPDVGGALEPAQDLHGGQGPDRAPLGPTSHEAVGVEVVQLAATPKPTETRVPTPTATATVRTIPVEPRPGR